MENLSYNEKTKILTCKELNIEIPPEGLGQQLYESLKKHTGKLAQLDIDTGETDSYESLLERSTRCAVWMQNYGLQPGDIISIYSHNHFDCGTTFLAATFLGVINASLDPALPEADLKYLLQLVTPKLLFVSKECENLAKNMILDLKLATNIVVYGETSTFIEFSKVIEPNAKVEVKFKPYIPQDLNETIIIVFSSGTTGVPKAVCFDHNYVLYQTWRPMSPIMFYTSTLYWITGSMMFVAMVRSGYLRTMCKTFNMKLLWDKIENYKIDAILLHHFHIMEFIACKPADLITSVKLLMVAGGRISKENILKIKQEVPNTLVTVPYGMTEMGTIAYPYDNISYNKHICGLLVENMACKIVDPDTEEPLGLNKKGEIRLKGKHSLKGFYRESSCDILDKDGFFKTGDIGYLDEDLCLFVVGRIKLMFRFRCFQINPEYIEEIIINHPDVHNAAVVPVPHSEDGVHILAVVELKKNSKVTEESIENYCNDQLNDLQKIRAGVKIIEALPLTPTGKIARNTLKNLMLKESGHDPC